MTECTITINNHTALTGNNGSSTTSGEQQLTNNERCYCLGMLALLAVDTVFLALAPPVFLLCYCCRIKYIVK
jgi:hypothetical protein